ncbi:MAG: hypothetical protein G01um10143_426 [Parcubacteria group bacterium Gr01-1014_3]|nr:MAG: hypothetical protein G01um10143_426 [Parcubacteria group bacterium Gr01-1014_3]
MTGLQKIAASLLLLICGYFLFFTGASADEFTSENFKVLEPVINPGGYSTSDNYQLIGTITQIGIGRSTADNFEVQGGFLYYPAPSAAAVAAETVSEVGGNVGGGGPILAIFQKFLQKTVPRGSVGDLNADGHVNLTDVSIVLYFWEKPIQKPNFVAQLASIIGLGRPSPDINKDSKIDIVDLSLLLSKWTG